MNELYSEHENSLRRFLVNELLERSEKVEVKRDLTTQRTQSATDSSAIADTQLARHFSNKHAK
jgi:hypothetical protein